MLAQKMCCKSTHGWFMIQLGMIENNRTTEKFAMATKADKKSGGAKTSRSETVTVRLDPKMRYLAEIAARVQRRTLSSYIEWAVEDALKRTTLCVEDDGTEVSVFDVDAKTPLWDVDEADRFAILASLFPDLLNVDEQRRWKLIWEVWTLTQPAKDTYGSMKGFRLDAKDLMLLRENWQLFKDAADAQTTPQAVVEALNGSHEMRRRIGLTAPVMRGFRAEMAAHLGEKAGDDKED